MEESSGKILVGASGYLYNDWTGPIYPDGLDDNQKLRYYVEELKLDTVELGQTYREAPERAWLDALIENTPDDFRFTAKASSAITERLRDSDGSFLRNEIAVDEYLRGLEPLIKSGKLLTVLAQFPLKFTRIHGAQDHLAWLAEKIYPAQLTVELRHESWVAQTVFDFLSSLNVAYSIADMPSLPKLARFNPKVTSNLAYFRLHGQNEKWFEGPTERSDYLYSQTQIDKIVEQIRSSEQLAGEIAVVLCNHARGQAAINARQLKESISG